MKHNKKIPVNFRDQIYNLSVVLEPDREVGGYSVRVPSLPGCFTEGNSVDEALKNAREAIICHLKGYLVDGEDLPLTPIKQDLITTVSVRLSDLKDFFVGPNAKVAVS